jgi:hypothetical protein
MGIKFYCPNGHKVNVKSFLAGKKGLCPKCGVRIDIPLQSVTKDQSHLISAADGNATDDSDELLGQISSEHPIAPTIRPTLSLVDDRPALENSQATSGLTIPAGLGVNSPTNGKASSLNMFEGQLVTADEAVLPPGSTSGPRFHGNAVWHVQFSTGQQLGPLDEAVLQQWVAEGRISPDDLIWREGWTQWQSAMAVFPHWRTNQNPTQSAPAGNPLNPADNPLLEAVQNSLPAASAGNWLHQRHRGKKEIRARLSLVLLGLVVLLFALLLYVFFMRDRPPEPKQTSISKAPFVATRVHTEPASMLA